MREGDTEGFGGKGRGMGEGRTGRERDSGIWVRGVEVNSRKKMQEENEKTEKKQYQRTGDREQMGQTGGQA